MNMCKKQKKKQNKKTTKKKNNGSRVHVFFFSNLNHGSLVETARLLAVLNWFCVTSIFRCFFFRGLSSFVAFEIHLEVQDT